MDSLPSEIIECILVDPCLSCNDVVSFSSTCSQFRSLVICSRAIWKSKYFQRWPKTDADLEFQDWYKEYMLRADLEKKALNSLKNMAYQFFHIDMKNIVRVQTDFALDLIRSHNLKSEHKHGYLYLRDYLLSINSLPFTQSLTHKYYANILLRFINKSHYEEVWNSLLKLSAQEQILEKGAIFISLWWQENASRIWEKVSSDLDMIANLVKQHVLDHSKSHPLNNVSEETLSTWRRENIPGNMFEPSDCKAILWSINHVLFNELKYWVRGDLRDFGTNKCGIDYALLDKKATPIIFAVIYESVARRLGVKIEVLDFQDHCLLKWREHYNCEGAPSHYINMDSRELFIKSRCPRRFNSSVAIAPCNMQQIAERAALYLYPGDLGESHLSLREALELLLVIKPYSLECYLGLSRWYMLHKMNSLDPILKLRSIRDQMSEVEWRPFKPLMRSLEIYQLTWEHKSTDPTPTPQRRVQEVEFAVGMIVREKLYDRTCVIYGWSTFPPMEILGTQVFYKLLADDGTDQYVSQERLQILHSPPFIFHPSIGRFFDEYCTTHYKPNKQLLAEYPEDLEALQQILKKDRKT